MANRSRPSKTGSSGGARRSRVSSGSCSPATDHRERVTPGLPGLIITVAGHQPRLASASPSHARPCVGAKGAGPDGAKLVGPGGGASGLFTTEIAEEALAASKRISGIGTVTPGVGFVLAEAAERGTAKYAKYAKGRGVTWTAPLGCDTTSRAHSFGQLAHSRDLRVLRFHFFALTPPRRHASRRP